MKSNITIDVHWGTFTVLWSMVIANRLNRPGTCLDELVNEFHKTLLQRATVWVKYRVLLKKMVIR